MTHGDDNALRKLSAVGLETAGTTQRESPDFTAHAGLALVVVQASGVSVRALPVSGALTIGRAADCDIQIDDALVSRHHATLHLAPLAIEDQASANGTRVQNELIAPRQKNQFELGQSICIGNALLVLRGSSPERSGPRQQEPERRKESTDGRVPPIDPKMQSLFHLLARVAEGGINVLLLGETGVGKDVAAEAIHARSPRKAGAFMRINCAALAEPLLESELFGHERGAFTGATTAKPGLIEAADGGTVFLDEVGEIPPSLQAKLLVVLEANEVTRVGGVRGRPIDVRYVAATNRDLEAEVDRGKFRADLFFRLNGVTLRVPPLRERKSEVLPLAELFARRAAEQMALPVTPRLGADARRRLESHTWPGNVRELRNVVERAVLLCGGDTIRGEDLEFSQVSAPGPAGTARATNRAPEPEAEPGPLRDQARQFERERIVEALASCHGNQTRAAKLLGMPRRTLVQRLTLFGIPRPRKS